MRISMRRAIPWVYVIMAFARPSSAPAQADSLSTVKVEAPPVLLQLLQTWDSTIWFFTPSDKPIRTLEGLTRTDVAIWGAEHFHRTNDFFRVLGLEGEGVKLVGAGSYNEIRPLVYITWARYASDLRGVSRVKFVEKAPPPQ